MLREAKKTCYTEEEGKIFIECAEFVLPWLSHRELASVSLTCKTLNSLSERLKIYIVIKVSDASRNLEKNPIPFINTIDSEPNLYFIYTFSQIFSSPCVSQSWGSNFERNVSSSFSLIKFGSNVTSLMTDSTSGCVCKNCSEDINGYIEIVKDARKGWSLYSAQFIPRGEFCMRVCRKRQKKYDDLASTSQFGSALLVMRQYLPSGNACLRLNIDATRVGNAARFINLPVTVATSLFPRLCFFASRDILDGEELAFSYGESMLKAKGLKCFCGSSSCLGALPSEET
ncbi:hypothetical protein MKX01_026317 [Papaver californicum]|nr:hypothetical protein MKX01_026317 [Papaver californicum]